MPKYVYQGSVPVEEWVNVYRKVVQPLRRVAVGRFTVHLRLEVAGVRNTDSIPRIQQEASALGLRQAVSVVDDYHQAVE